MPNLTYIGQAPAEGPGSPIIVLRHLQRLAAHGWSITVIPETGQNTSACEAAGWPIKYLPTRRGWWPPFRPESNLSRSLRTWLLGRECRRLLQDNPPDALFGYLAAHADFSTEIISQLARQSGVPLSLLIHDDAATFAKSDHEKKLLRRRHARILRRAHRCWFVSPELAREYDVPENLRQTLLPIPEGGATPARWTPTRSQPPRVYYAGALWPAQFPILAKIARILQSSGARLVILSKETPELNAFLAAEPADGICPFATNREALAHLSENAAGVLVAYPETIAEMPWVATSFPSKWIEYSHLGLPCAIVAHDDSAVARWAVQHHFPHRFTGENLFNLGIWASTLAQENSWQALAAASRTLAAGPFDPTAIHQQFEGALLR
jgi:hypothetical protein